MNNATLLTPPVLPYGSDEHGLICGFRFVPGEPAQPLNEAAPLPGGIRRGFVWLHFNLSHAGAERWLRQHANLSENFFEALNTGSRSTRIERDGEVLFAVVNDVAFEFSFDVGDVATLWLSVSEHVVVSARRHPLRAVDRLRMAVRRGTPLPSSVALLDHLLREQADELQRVVRKTTERVDDIEDEVLAGKHRRHDAELARLRRLMVRLQRLLALEPGALMRVLVNPPSWIAAEDVQRLRQANEEFALVLRDIAGLQERIKLMQDEAAARVAEENNRSLFLLTMVTVMALPINLVSGLFGMNVGGIPLGEHPTGFWIMVGLIGALTGAIALFALKRLRPRRE
ncbi:MAG: transporter [Burkholderiaceae bacterium]|nr:transporter [Burkholderiaceae bacterium]